MYLTICGLTHTLYPQLITGGPIYGWLNPIELPNPPPIETQPKPKHNCKWYSFVKFNWIWLKRLTRVPWGSVGCRGSMPHDHIQWQLSNLHCMQFGYILTTEWEIEAHSPAANQRWRLMPPTKVRLALLLWLEPTLPTTLWPLRGDDTLRADHREHFLGLNSVLTWRTFL